MLILEHQRRSLLVCFGLHNTFIVYDQLYVQSSQWRRLLDFETFRDSPCYSVPPCLRGFKKEFETFGCL